MSVNLMRSIGMPGLGARTKPSIKPCLHAAANDQKHGVANKPLR